MLLCEATSVKTVFPHECLQIGENLVGYPEDHHNETIQLLYLSLDIIVMSYWFTEVNW